MPSLLVLSRSLCHLPGDAKEFSRSEVLLPPSGDALTALLSSITAAKNSELEITVPRLRWLDAEESIGPLACQAKAEARSMCLVSAYAAARRGSDEGFSPALRLAAVSRGEWCAALLREAP